jgi:hypothetical protein
MTPLYKPETPPVRGFFFLASSLVLYTLFHGTTPAAPSFVPGYSRIAGAFCTVMCAIRRRTDKFGGFFTKYLGLMIEIRPFRPQT